MLVNKVKEKLARGEVTYGTLLSFPSTDMVRFFGLVGYDWVFSAAEHDPAAPETGSPPAETAHLRGTTPIVHVPNSPPGPVPRPLAAATLGSTVPARAD